MNIDHIVTHTGVRYNKVVIASPMRFYRVKHDRELGALWRQDPEVFQLEPDHRTNFTADMQMLSYRLNTTDNQDVDFDITGAKWRVLFDTGRAFNNGTGFDRSGDPRADYVNVRDIDKPLPQFHRPLVCGGATITGVEDGAYLWVETLRVQDPVPSLEWMLAHWWLYFDAVTVGADGDIGRFPQGTNGSRVFVPLVTTQAVRYPLAKLEKLPVGSGKANPYAIG